MKRLVLALAAIAAAAGPIATAGTAQAQQRGGYERDRNDGRDSYRGNDYRGNDSRGGYDRGRNDYRGHDYRGNDNRRYDNRRYDNRGWDASRNNGYYLGNRWYYGRPAVTYYGRPDYRPAYRAWSRGSYLPHSYRSYRVHDYHRYHLRQPPRGYGWVRANNDYVLMALATGLILDVIVGNNYY